MRFERLTIGGCVPFPVPQTIIFPDAQKVAVVGDNGAGKSTFLDAIFIALYGDTTKPGGVYPLFPGRDGLVELAFSYKGHTYTIKRLIDGEKRVQKAWIYKDGQCLNEGKVSQFPSIVEGVLNLPEDVFLASVYNAQTQKGNPLSLKDGQRRELLSQVLGLQMFDEPFAMVVEAARQADDDYKIKATTDTLLAKELEGWESNQDQLQALQAESLTKEAERATLETQVNEYRQRLAALEADATDLVEAQGNVARLKNQIQASRDTIDKNRQSLDKNQTVLVDKRAEILAAVNIVAEQTTIRERKRGDLETLMSDHAVAMAEYQRDIAAQQTEMAAKTASVTEAQSQVNKAEMDLKTAQFNADTLEKQIVELQGLAQLGDVPCGGLGDYAGCSLIAHRVEAGKRLELAMADLPKKYEAVETLKLDVARLTSGLTTIREELTALSAAHSTGPESAKRVAQLNEAIGVLQKEIADLDALIAINKQLADLAPELSLAEERMEGYRTRNAELVKQIVDDEKTMAEWEAKIITGAEKAELIRQAHAAIADLAASMQSYTTALADIQNAIGRYEAYLQKQTEAAINQTKVRDEMLALARRCSDLAILKQALGPKGARALKIDAAGPAISELVNHLLRECFGHRFTIVIRTQKALVSDDAELRECLEFSIIDNETGLEAPVEQKSGGEQQLIREVISLGLCIYQRQQTGADTRTIIRDEACSALTEENTERYVAMLATACELGGFDQVFYVSHKKVAHTMADAFIEVGGGTITQPIAA